MIGVDRDPGLAGGVARDADRNKPRSIPALELLCDHPVDQCVPVIRPITWIDRCRRALDQPVGNGDVVSVDDPTFGVDAPAGGQDLETGSLDIDGGDQIAHTVRHLAVRPMIQSGLIDGTAFPTDSRGNMRRSVVQVHTVLERFVTAGLLELIQGREMIGQNRFPFLECGRRTGQPERCDIRSNRFAAANSVIIDCFALRQPERFGNQSFSHRWSMHESADSAWHAYCRGFLADIHNHLVEPKAFKAMRLEPIPAAFGAPEIQPAPVTNVEQAQNAPDRRRFVRRGRLPFRIVEYPAGRRFNRAFRLAHECLHALHRKLISGPLATDVVRPTVVIGQNHFADRFPGQDRLGWPANAGDHSGSETLVENVVGIRRIQQLILERRVGIQ